MRNPFKQPPLIRIEMGQDTAGVPIMRIQLDQMWAKHHTGQFVANPVCFVPTALFVQRPLQGAEFLGKSPHPIPLMKR